MNHQVSIPVGFFLAEAKNEYYDYRSRLVVELLQNSLDAGATRIDLDLNDVGYSCTDNGRGMSKDRMVSALLTMGGSEKEKGATGGFGAAKKLLLFSHASFSIESNGTVVSGEGLSYRFDNSNNRSGTKVSAIYAPEFKGCIVLEKAESLLAKCDFRGRCKVYVSGDLFTNYLRQPLVREIPNFGEVYGSKGRTDSNVVIVRHNGLYMFDRYVSGLNRSVIVEAQGKSTDIFTQNRDGFRDSYSREFDKIVGELTINKESFIKAKPRKFVLSGSVRFVSWISRKLDLSSEIKGMIERIKNMGTAIPTSGLAAHIDSQVASMNLSTKEMSDITTIKDMIKNHLETDFHFDLADSTYTKVPDKYVPNTGKKKFTELAALWKTAIREVLSANGMDQNFVIGFTFDSNAVATHTKSDGVSRYMINPTSEEIDTGTKQEKVLKILTTAVHEVVHSKGKQYHDEEFVLNFHKLLVPTLVNGPTWRQLLKMSKTVKV